MRIAQALVASSLIVAGCQHFDRARECRALADGVNPELQELSAVYGKRTPIAASDYRNAGNKYMAAAARLGKLKFKDPELTHLADDLRENLTAIARTCDRVAAKVEHSEKAVDTAARDLEGLRQRHVTLVGSVDKACQPGA